MHKPNIALNSGAHHLKDVPEHKNLQSAQLLHHDYGRQLDPTWASCDPFYALTPMFRFALCSNMALLNLIASMVRRELSHSSMVTRGNCNLSNLLFHQRILKRHIRNLQEPIIFMEGVTSTHWFSAMTLDQQQRCEGNVQTILRDYRAALEQTQALCEECIQGMSIVAHNATTQEAQKAFEETRAVNKLTKLAVFFVPLSFTTSVFGMNVTELGANGAPRIWVWVLVSAGLSIMTYIFFRWQVLRLWTYAIRSRG